MEPGDAVTVATLISSLLNVTLIDNGDLFDAVGSVLLAGLTMAGTPAINVGASFSSMPQHGKLKALM